MTLQEKQVLFAGLVARLLQRAGDLGYEATFGETWRTDEQAAINALGEAGRARLVSYLEQRSDFHALAIAIANNGKSNGILLSIHRDRLAIDLNLFRGGVWLQRAEDHQPLGEWWEKQHELCRWGGRFRDGNHYSLEHEGRR